MAPEKNDNRPGTDIPAAFIAANRFGLGARPGEIEEIAADPHAWLTDQILSGRADPVPGVETTQQRLHYNDLYFAAKAEAEKAEAAAIDGAAIGANSTKPTTTEPARSKKPKPDLGTSPGGLMENDVSRRADMMVTTDKPFIERLVAFWTNHFSVTNLRGDIAALAVPYENEAIRPNVFGLFQDMLLATAAHPAMLFYLDAATSVGPESSFGRRHHQSVNENYAREIMELHTLGAHGGYTQQDVQQLALVLTGLGIDRADGAGVWFFDRHEPGERKILGRTIGGEAAQFEIALTILAKHPATVNHVSTKLAAHFCGDTPSQAVVRRISDAWRKSGGNLTALYLALVNAPEAWAPHAVKYRTPQDFVIAAARAFGIHGHGRNLFDEFCRLGQQPFQAPAPTGWSDLDSAWIDPAGVLARVASAQRLAAFVDLSADAAMILPQVVYLAPDSSTLDVVMNEQDLRTSVTLALASPEFQRR